MDENLVNFKLDRITTTGKTVEQLKRNALDPSLEGKPIDKALYLLQKGDSLQKLSVVNTFFDLMEESSEMTLTKILPKIEQELLHANAEFHIATTHMFQSLIENRLKADEGVTVALMKGIDSRDPAVANAWLQTLLEVITYLPYNVIQNQIIPFAVKKGLCIQTSSKIMSCKVIGKIVLHSEIIPLHIQKDILPTVYSLCQDVNSDVRANICQQIPPISKVLGSSSVKNYLLPNLVELSSDNFPKVRAAAVSSVVEILPYLDAGTKSSTMVPLVTNLFESATMFDEVNSVISKNFGSLLKSLQKCVNPEQAKYFIKYYKKLSITKETKQSNAGRSENIQKNDYKENCATNFPAVFSFTMQLVPSETKDLYNTLKSFITDNDKAIRYSAAQIFHEVVQLLGKNNSMAKNEFIQLLEDEEIAVLQVFIPNLSTILTLFEQSDILTIEQSNDFSVEVGKALLRCLSLLRAVYNWRLLTNFLSQLEYLPFVFKSDYIYSEFAPVLLDCALNERAKPVRSQAAKTLVIFLKWNNKPTQKVELRKKIVHDLAENSCSYTRHVFIKLCAHALDIFSNKFFKANFFVPLVHLINDRVSNIRYCTLALVPTLQTMVNLPEDHRLFQNLNDEIVRLERSEKDKDVLENLANIHRDTRKITFKTNVGIPAERETRLVEEEENIIKGKFNWRFISQEQNKAQDVARKSRKQSIGSSALPLRSHRNSADTAERGHRNTPILGFTTVTRTAMIPKHMTTSREIISDMTFLKQHFYIDAGINLPMQDTSLPDFETTDSNLKKPNDDVSTDLSNLSINNIESNLNITDDVKLRKKNNRLSELPVANFKKRHSTVLPANSAASSTAASNKRRSLNINQKDCSRIPVLNKPSEVEMSSRAKTETTTDVSKVKEMKKCSSNLPVLVRKK